MLPVRCWSRFLDNVEWSVLTRLRNWLRALVNWEPRTGSKNIVASVSFERSHWAGERS